MDTRRIGYTLGVLAQSHDEKSSPEKEKMLAQFLAGYFTGFIRREEKKKEKIITEPENLTVGEEIDRQYFRSSSDPDMPIKDYILRLLKYGVKGDFLSKETTMIGMLIYMDRFLAATGVLLCHRNIHRLMLVSLCLISKINDDEPIKNKEMATIGGITNEELNELEAVFIQAISCNLYISTSEYQHYQRNMASGIAEEIQACVRDLNKLKLSQCFLSADKKLNPQGLTLNNDLTGFDNSKKLKKSMSQS